MEVLIASGIALLGYRLSAAAEPAPSRRRAPRSYARRLDARHADRTTRDDDAEFGELVNARWEEARDPGASGLVTPNTRLPAGAAEVVDTIAAGGAAGTAGVPFFKSAKSQHTNEAYKQTKLETFTGAVDMATSATGTYRAKREVEAMFPPKQNAGPVTSSGSMGNQPYQRDDARFVRGTYHNNIAPAARMRVGRGVGVDPTVVATDGFHPMYRVLMKNVGEYKKNNLPGQVNHGAAKVTNAAGDGPQARVEVNHRPDALVYTQEDRPMMPTMAAVTARQVVPDSDDRRVYKMTAVHERFGNPTVPGHEIRGAAEARIGYAASESRRDDGVADHPDRNLAFPRINVTGATAGVGAFTTSSFDTAKVEAQQREWIGNAGFVGGLPPARAAPQGFVLPPTQRDMLGFGGGCTRDTEYFGGVGRNDGGFALRRADEVKRTLRDTQGDAHGLLGAKGSVLGGAFDNVWRFNRLDRESKKVVAGDVARPARMNAPVGMGAVANRDDSSEAFQTFIPSLPNKGYQESLGRLTTPYNKLPHNNPRLSDLSLAADQLRGNPYAQRPLCESG